MKIRVDIHPGYRETEVRICSSECTEEVKNIYCVIKEALDVRLTAYEGNEIRQIDGNAVIRIYSQNQKVYVSTKDGDFCLRERLYELEGKLDATRFLRISNSEIVNLRKIVRMDTSITGTIKMYLQGNVETYVSRRYVTRIKKALGIGRNG